MNEYAVKDKNLIIMKQKNPPVRPSIVISSFWSLAKNFLFIWSTKGCTLETNTSYYLCIFYSDRCDCNRHHCSITRRFCLDLNLQTSMTVNLDICVGFYWLISWDQTSFEQSSFGFLYLLKLLFWFILELAGFFLLPKAYFSIKIKILFLF